MTKIPTEVIKLAIEGGWKGYLGRIAHTEETLEGWFRYSAEQEWEFLALDREFWESLGRKLGWNEEKAFREGYTNIYGTIWQCVAHEFYTLVLSGQDPTEFWASLVKDN